MADTKISALTGASTPLVGTEVLPIVQSGTTVKVSVANLTSGRAISAAGITDSTITQGSVLFAGTSGLFSQSNADFFWDNSNKRLGLGTATPSTPITVYRGSAANTYIRTQNTVADIDFGVDGGGTGIMWNNANKPLAFGTNGVQRCTIAAAGDVTVNTGNLVIGTAGKGIDFSGGVLWRTGTGSPEGVVTASVGSMYTNVAGGSGTTLYVKESGSGNTGWVAK